MSIGMPTVLRVLALTLLSAATLRSQTPVAPTQGAAPPVPTLKLKAQLVVLDITVLDKHGHPVTSGLTKDDFVITEDKKPQRVLSFEPPEAHAASALRTDETSFGNIPATVFVLDELNVNFEQNAYYRISLRKYLEFQPSVLPAPAELMVVSAYNATEIVQGFTRSRDDLVAALDHVPAELPSPDIDPLDRLRKTFGALEGIALESMGANGRKNVVWLGTGVSFRNDQLSDRARASVNEYMRRLTNTLVEGRVTLHMIFPALEAYPAVEVFGDDRLKDRDADVTDPYGDLFNFRALAHETGGAIFANENFIDQVIAKVLDYGLNYYTLSYRPQSDAMDSKFRQIRVKMRDPNLRAVTKTGYYSPDQRESSDPQRQAFFQLAEAAQSSLPFDELHIVVDHIVRHPDAGTTEFALRITPKNIPWMPDDQGTSSTVLGLAAMSLAQRGAVLAYKTRSPGFRIATQDPAILSRRDLFTSVTLPMSRKTNHIRFVVRAMDTGRMGAVDVSRQAIDAAPEAPTPEPVIPPLQKHPAVQTPATN
jgi:VWFA-related protein